MVLGFWIAMAALVLVLLLVLEFRQRRARRRGLTDAQLQTERGQRQTPNTAPNIRGEYIGLGHGPSNSGGTGM